MEAPPGGANPRAIVLDVNDRDSGQAKRGERSPRGPAPASSGARGRAPQPKQMREAPLSAAALLGWSAGARAAAARLRSRRTGRGVGMWGGPVRQRRARPSDSGESCRAKHCALAPSSARAVCGSRARRGGVSAGLPARPARGGRGGDLPARGGVSAGLPRWQVAAAGGWQGVLPTARRPMRARARRGRWARRIEKQMRGGVSAGVPPN